MGEHEFMRKLAIKDLTEIRSADLLVVDTFMPSETGGKEVELGFGLGLFQSKLVYIVGPLRNVFHYLADANFLSWEDFLKDMEDA